MSRPHSIVILSGAGLSAESGIRTFRDTGGLWETERIEDVATPEGFARNPALVHRFYNERRAALSSVEPNPAHMALAKLQDVMAMQNRSLLLVTQNVDDLLERAGANDVVHMHGELLRLLCSACGWAWDHRGDCTTESVCPACHTKGTPRPDIVWFGEMPYHMDRIERALSACDLFVSIGTSGAVYPAAGFVQTARRHGAQTLELNLEPSEGSTFFHGTRLGPAGQVVPDWVGEMI